MADRVASIFAEIGLDAGKFNTGASSILSGLDDITGAFGMTSLATLTAGGALAMVYGELLKAGEAAEEAAKAQAKLDAVLKATDHSAGLTSEELGKLADQLALTAGLDDELVKSSEAVMLTFRNIKGDNFRLAMQAATDLSAVLDNDLQGSVMQVSKALNDFSGYTALKRAGVSFSEEQERQIKNFKETNNLAGYQSLVLKELQGEFGGAAEAMTGASSGSAALNKAVGDLYENIGNLLLPGVRDTNRELTNLITTINNNWAAVTGLYNAVANLYRIVLAISTLGVSELLRWYFSRPAAGSSATEPPPVPHASGGSFLIPQSYGNEGFRLGNGDTASGGERLIIVPGNGFSSMSASEGGGGGGPPSVVEELARRSFVENLKLGSFLEKEIKMNFTENRKLGDYMEKYINMGFAENRKLADYFEKLQAQYSDNSKSVQIGSLHVGNGPNVMTREQAMKMIKEAFDSALRR